MGARLLDHRGEPIAQRRRKTEMPTVRARYDAAQTSVDNQNHWAWADGMSAAAANSPEVRRKLRERARYEVANNSYAAGMVRTYANDVVGVGPQLQIDTGSDARDSRIEREFSAWWRAAGLSEKLRTARMSRMVDGEVFARFVINPPLRLRHPVALDIKLYEGDQISKPWIAPTDPLMSDGIIFDDFGNPIGYTILRRHPGDMLQLGVADDWELVPAANIIHLFRLERPGQVRGVPELLSALPLYAQLRRYTLAVIAAAETAADMAGVMHSTSPSVDPDDVEPLDLIDIERRTLMTMPRGWDISQLKAEQPSTNYQMFKREIIQEQARCISQPYGVASGDHSGFNYASGKLDSMNYDRAIRVDRKQLENEFLDAVFQRWWEFALQSRGVLPRGMTRQQAPPTHEWRWEGKEHQDPAKEATAQATRLESRTTSLAREYSRLGLDWEAELRQIAKEESLLKELGLDREQSRPSAPQTGRHDAQDEDED